MVALREPSYQKQNQIFGDKFFKPSQDTFSYRNLHFMNNIICHIFCFKFPILAMIEHVMIVFSWLETQDKVPKYFRTQNYSLLFTKPRKIMQLFDCISVVSSCILTQSVSREEERERKWWGPLWISLELERTAAWLSLPLVLFCLPFLGLVLSVLTWDSMLPGSSWSCPYEEKQMTVRGVFSPVPITTCTLVIRLGSLVRFLSWYYAILQKMKNFSNRSILLK